MTSIKVQSVRLALIGAAALALAGCSGTHVGETWQCPLAQGASCTSIADADPAVPETAPAPAPEARPAVREPLYRSMERRRSGAGRGAVQTDGSCETGCGPFAWVARWLGLEGGETPVSPSGVVHRVDGTRSDAGAQATGLPPATAAGAADTGGTAVARETQTEGDEAAPTALVQELAAEAALRAPEAIGRIWIAPHVDAHGIYREGAYVRAVLEPAGWRVP